MSIFDDILFWRKKKKEIVVPYKLDNKEIYIENKATNVYENLKPIDLAKIETIDFPKTQYFQEIYEKKEIVLHHTVGSTVDGAISEWLSTPDRVATCIIIDRAGIPFQLFSSKFWAAHLKCGNLNLDRHSIAVEIVSWGQLIPTSPGRFKTYYGNEVFTIAEYYPNGFREYNYFEKYTDAQIITLGELLLYWNKVYNIPLDYKDDMWDLSQNALRGESGVFCHTSYRKDKSDLHPQKNLIEMLKTLNGIVS
jgi:hypothetical protein